MSIAARARSANPSVVTDVVEPEVLHSLNPADGTLVDSYPMMGEDDVRELVDRARAASAWWQDQGFKGRAKALGKWRNLIWRNVDEIAELMHRENGKPVDDAVVEAMLAVEHLHWVQHHAARILRPKRVNPGLLLANYGASVDYVPHGVVGVISPWNYPLYAPNSSVSFALMAGNTVILKPSEFTPATSDWYVQAFHKANPEAPAGVLQLATGDGRTGAALCLAGVNKIGFTGSTRTGKRIMAQCAENLVPVLLECGGKDPAIIAADADLKSAAEAVAWGAFTNGGQTCVGVERVYIVDSVRDEFLGLLREQLRGVRSGSDADAAYGPMTMPAQVEIVRRHVTEAIAAGGQAIIGGAHSVGERFIEPVVIVDAPEDCSAVREETFGPTLTVTTVRSVDEAVELANDHEYALSAAVFSRHHAKEIASRLRVGQVSINAVIAFAGMGSVPMGGVGGSGFGRVHGEDGLREFVRPHGQATKRFEIPGMELITLHRPAHLLPLMKKVLDIRHGR